MARIHARRRAWHTALGDKRPREQQPPLSERAEPCYRVWRGRSTHLGKRLKTRRAGGLTSSGPRFESIIAIASPTDSRHTPSRHRIP